MADKPFHHRSVPGRYVVDSVVRALVDNEQAININEVHGEKSVVFEVRLDAADYGKVIGRDGSHAKALRLLLSAASKKYGTTYTLSIVDGKSER